MIYFLQIQYILYTFKSKVVPYKLAYLIVLACWIDWVWANKHKDHFRKWSVSKMKSFKNKVFQKWSERKLQVTDFLLICIFFYTFFPSAIYSESIEPLCVLHSRFPNKKLWVVAYLKFTTIFLRIKKKKINFILCNFLVRTLQCF